MNEETKLRYLKIALYVFGIFFIFGIYIMKTVWPSVWAWEPRQYEYEQMIEGIYATLGVFLILAAKDPLAHRSLIWFTIWSSIVHGGIMLVQALMDETMRGKFFGSVPAIFFGPVPGIFLVAIVLWVLMLKAQVTESVS